MDKGKLRKKANFIDGAAHVKPVDLHFPPDIMPDTDPLLPLQVGQTLRLATPTRLSDGSYRFVVSAEGADVDFALDGRNFSPDISICAFGRRYNHHPEAIKVQIVEERCGAAEGSHVVSTRSICLLCQGEARRLRSACPSNVRAHAQSHDENEFAKQALATRCLLVGLVAEYGLSPELLESRRVRDFLQGKPACSVERYAQIEEKVSIEALAVVLFPDAASFPTRGRRARELSNVASPRSPPCHARHRA
jgi:hypothetical protein